MMPDGADLVAVVVRGLGSHGAENGQGQDGDDQLFHGDVQNHRVLRGETSTGRKLVIHLRLTEAPGKGGDNGYQHD